MLLDHLEFNRVGDCGGVFAVHLPMYVWILCVSVYALFQLGLCVRRTCLEDLDNVN